MKSPALLRSIRDPARFRRHLMAAAATTLFALPQPAQAATINVAGACTLTGAINSANSNTAQGGCTAGSGADIIVLPASVTLTSATAPPAISSPITIQGNGSTLQRGSGAPAFRLFDVTAAGDLTLNDLTVTNGQITGTTGVNAGGGIRSQGRLVLNRCTVTGNRSEVGGGIGVAAGTFELNDSTVSANSSTNDGGGVFLGYNAPITATLTGSTITGNISGYYGGGLKMGGDDLTTLTIAGSTISNNTATRRGGGINALDSLTITGSTISGNTAQEFGGGILIGGSYGDNRDLVLRDSTVTDNRAVSDGGAGIAAYSANLLLVNSTVSGNRAGLPAPVNYDGYGSGGGIYHYGGGGSVRLKYSTVSGNSALGGGGGIFSRASVTLSNSQVTGNTAAYSGGGILTNSVALEVKYSSVSNNVTPRRGGGILVESDGSTRPGSLSLTNSTVAGNRSVQETGGIDLSFDVTALIENSTIAANRGAGVTALNRASATIRSSTITGNSFVAPSPSFGGAGIAKTGGGVLTLERNIVSGNGIVSSVPGQEISLQAGVSTLNNNGFNVLGSSAHTSAQAFNAFTPMASDRTATSNGTHPTTIGNILGAGPAAIGGPTLAFNTRGGSPARDFIPSAMCAGEIDQRGVVRPKNGQGGASANECDAGSVESSGFNAVDLSITKTSNGPVFVGQPLTFSITVRNDGPEPANGIELFDTLPAGLEFASINEGDGFFNDCFETSGTVECRMRRLAPAQAVTFNLVTRTTAVGPVTNEVSFLNDTLINTNASGTDFDAAVTTQVIGPTVTLSATPASIVEAGGVATLRASLSQTASIPVVVNLAYTGTAGTGDYTRPASITVPAGATSAIAPLTALADTADETDESIIASISSVPNGMIGTPNSVPVSIIDDDDAPTVSFTAATQSVSEGAASVTVTAQLSAVSGRAVTVPINFAGTAANPADYSRSATSIVIPAGSASASLTLTLVDDTLDEPNETVVMSFGALVNATPGAVTTQTVTIIDTDLPPTVTLAASPLSIAEAAGVSTLTATLSAVSSLPVTVNLAYTGTASAADSTRPASISIPAGSLSGTALVTSTQDTLDENDETVIVDISTVSNATETGTQQRTLTITDDDAPPSISFIGTTQTVDETAGTVTVSMTMSRASGLAVTVPLTFTGSATNPADYSPSATTLTIPVGATSGSITLSLVNETLDESNETVVITRGTPVNANFVGPTVYTVNITDDDATPTVTLAASPLSIAEAAGVSTLTATLSAASSLPVTVNLSYTGTASAGDSTRPASITIPAGSLSGTALVIATQDTLEEDDESLIVDIGSVSNATESGTQQRTLTIVDDDAAPTVTLAASPLSIAEAAGVSTLTATLSAASSQPVTVNLAYTGTASAADSSRPASIGIPAGSLSGTATITATQDTLDENDETLIVDISSVPNGKIGSPNSATVTIIDDDATPTVSFAVGTLTVGEGTNRTVTAQLSALSGRVVTVPINFAGTAANPDDYSRSATSIVIPAGSGSGSLTLNFVDDTLDEPNETVVMSFGTLVNATAGGITTQTVTITDNDAPPTVTLAASPLSIAEAAGVSTLTATLSATSSLPVTVNLAYTGTATNLTDYTRSGVSISIPAGSLSGAVTVTAVQDTLDENDETVVVDIDSVVNGSESGSQQVTTTILDDEPPPVISIGDASVIEGNGGTVVMNFPVSIPVVSRLPVTVTYTTALDGGANAADAADFVSISGSVTIPAGMTSVNAPVTVNGDLLFENNETLLVNLSGAINATLGGAQATGTITNDDVPPDDNTPPTVTFLIGTESAGEAAGLRSLTVQLSAISSLPTTVPFTVAGTASAADYSVLSISPLTIPAGSLSTVISFSIVNDTLVEPDEQLIFTLNTPTNATLGTPSKSLLTIRDNDAPPPDAVPDAFNFTDRRGVKARTDITSNTITVSGLSNSTPTAVTLTNGSGGDASYSINGAAFGKTAATVRNGDTVRLRNRIPDNSGTANATLTIGGVGDAWKITTSK
ncbi:MAG: beta strand repeat-containing protein [Panacagrimonas sp.]